MARRDDDDDDDDEVKETGRKRDISLIKVTHK